MWDDEAGYDRDDPKHPDWADAMADRADMDRKREKEEPPGCPTCGAALKFDSGRLTCPRGHGSFGDRLILGR